MGLGFLIPLNLKRENIQNWHISPVNPIGQKHIKPVCDTM